MIQRIGLLPARRLISASELLGQRRGHRVDDQHAVVADLHRGVHEAADQHPDVALDVQRLHRRRGAAGRRRRVRRVPAAAATVTRRDRRSHGDAAASQTRGRHATSRHRRSSS